MLAQQGMDFTARKVIEFNVHEEEPVWICCLTCQVVVGFVRPGDGSVSEGIDGRLSDHVDVGRSSRMLRHGGLVGSLRNLQPCDDVAVRGGDQRLERRSESPSM